MIKAVQSDIFNNNIHVQEFEPRVRSHISHILAVEIVRQQLLPEDIPIRIKTIEKPVFENEIDINEDYDSITDINKKIRYLFTIRGYTPREIMKEVDKTYTRVKNVIKKIKING